MNKNRFKKFKVKHLTTLLFLALLYAASSVSYSQSISELNSRAESMYEQKKYTEALSLWLDILTIDQDNIKAMQKIEEVYEVKQTKDLAFQKTKIDYRKSREKLKDKDEDTIEAGIVLGWDAINTFKVAFRLDPNDGDVKELRERLRILEKELLAAEEQMNLSKAVRAKIAQLRIQAREKQDNKIFEAALDHWEEIIDYLPQDVEALEGKRTCKLAIENRLKFEKIHGMLAKGKDFFDIKQYKNAKTEYLLVLEIDKKNREAVNQLERIDELLEDENMRLIKMQQAETLYQSGINNLANYNFDQARDEFESVLSLIKDYKDTKIKLASIDGLRKEFELKQREQKLQLIDTLFQEGLVSYSSSKYETAIAKFDKTLSLDPENKLAREYLEKSRNSLKQKQEDTVDENSPYYKLVNSLVVSGKQLYDSGKYAESAKKWDQITKLFPKNQMAREYALKCLNKLNPGKLDKFSQDLFASGKAYLKEKKFKQAENEFLLLKSINDGFPGIDSYIARAKAEPVEDEGGGGDIQVVPVDKADLERKYQAAMGLYQKGGKENVENALATFKWIVKKDPGNVKAVINVNKIEAQLRINIGGTEAKVALLSPELRKKAQLHYYNGISYYSNNNFKKAIDEWQKVLLIDPSNIKAKNNIRKTMAFLGKYGNE